jgi:hypothetical protein
MDLVAKSVKILLWVIVILATSQNWQNNTTSSHASNGKKALSSLNVEETQLTLNLQTVCYSFFCWHMVPHADYKVEPWCTLIWKQEFVECWSGINFWTYQLDVAFKSCRASIKGWDIWPWSQWSFVILNVRCLGSIKSDLDDITRILEDQSLQRSVWSNTAKLSCMMQNNLLFRFW